MKRHVKSFMSMALALLMVFCVTTTSLSSYAATSKKKTIKPTKVTLSSHSSSLWIGGTKKLSAKVSPSNATNKKVKYSSSNSSVASVSSSGTVTAKKAGKAKITVTTSNGKKDTCTITVRKNIKVLIDAYPREMNIGDEEELEVIVENTENDEVTWSSSNKDVISVKQDGTITAYKTGSATITAKSKANSKFKDSVTISVREVEVAFSGEGVSYDALNQTYYMRVLRDEDYVLYFDVYNLEDTTTKWKISNGSVIHAEKSDDRELEFTASSKVGTCEVTATTSTGKSESITIEVVDGSDVTDVYFGGRTLIDEHGKPVLLVAAGYTEEINFYVDGYENKRTIWKITDPTIASIESSDESSASITGVSAGETILSATIDNNVTASVTVRVSPRETDDDVILEEVTFPENTEIQEKTTLIEKIEWEPYHLEVDIEAESSDTNIIKAKYLGGGNVEITAVSAGVATVNYTVTDKKGTTKKGVTVYTVVEEEVPPIELVLDVESSIELKEGGNTVTNVSYAPEDAVLEASSTNTSIATVESFGNGVYLVKGISAGVASIQWKLSYAGFTKTATTVVNVEKEDVPVIDLTLEVTDSVELNEGEQQVVTATYSPDEATLSCSSSNTSVATVADYGNGKYVVKGISAGTTSLNWTLSYDGKTKTNTTLVTVSRVVEETNLELSVPGDVSAEVGDTAMIDVSFSPDAANLTAVCQDTSIATLTPYGNGKYVVTGMKAGITSINYTLTYNGAKKTATTIVKITDDSSDGGGGGTAEQTPFDKNFDYTIQNNQVMVTGFHGEGTIISIPATHKGYPVVFVSAVFKGNTSIQGIQFAEENGKVASIQSNNASDWFRGCTKLAYVKGFPTNVTNMDHICYGCSSLITFKLNGSTASDSGCVEVPSGTTTLDYAFANCTSLDLSTSSRAKMLEKCTKLTTAIGLFSGAKKLTIAPDFSKCTKLSTLEKAFKGCTSLKSVSKYYIALPTSLTCMDEAFSGCTELVTCSIEMPSSVKSYVKCYYGCSSLAGKVYIDSSYLSTADKGTTGFKDMFTGTSGTIYVVFKKERETTLKKAFDAVKTKWSNVKYSSSTY